MIPNDPHLHIQGQPGFEVPALPGVHLAHWDVETGSDVFHSLVAFWDDAHAFGNGFGCDWMVSSDHDDLDQETGQFTECSCLTRQE